VKILKQFKTVKAPNPKPEDGLVDLKSKAFTLPVYEPNSTNTTEILMNMRGILDDLPKTPHKAEKKGISQYAPSARGGESSSRKSVDRKSGNHLLPQGNRSTRNPSNTRKSIDGANQTNSHLKGLLPPVKGRDGRDIAKESHENRMRKDSSIDKGGSKASGSREKIGTNVAGKSGSKLPPKFPGVTISGKKETTAAQQRSPSQNIEGCDSPKKAPVETNVYRGRKLPI